MCVTIGQNLARYVTSDVNPMSYINRIEHSIVITDITDTEVEQVILPLKNQMGGAAYICRQMYILNH